jgi:DNA-binding HxlR family transcriptional regulator
MQKTKLSEMDCPIARAFDRVGEWWSILILRDAFHGLTRFDQFQRSLSIAPNMLTRRLNALVAGGLLEKRLYNQHPPRYEYLLTERGQDFRPVMIALMAWGNRHFAPEGVQSILVDAATGIEAEPMLVDRKTLKPVTEQDFTFAAGPAATDAVKRRSAFVERRRASTRATEL